MDELTSRRIILVGKTGVGKSSLANTIFGENVFSISHFPISATRHSRSETKFVNGKFLTLIDTHSFLNTCGSETLPKTEIMRCITECIPGPHVFLIVLKVEKFTEQEQDVVKRICQFFSDDALKHAAVVFTHGDQLHEDMTIEEFVHHNKMLSDLVDKCRGKCHVVDNKYWKNNEEDEYRNNQVQVADLLRTVDEIIKANEGKYYTNELIEAVSRAIENKEEQIRQTSGSLSQAEIRNEARNNVFETLLIKFTSIAASVLVGAFLGVAGTVTSIIIKVAKGSPVSAADMVVLAVQSGEGSFRVGLDAAEGAQSPKEAMLKSAGAVWDQYYKKSSQPKK